MTDETRLIESTPSAPRRRRRMSRGQRWFIRILLFLVLLLALAVGAVLFADFQMDSTGRLAALEEGSDVFLVVGSDSRENLPDDLEGNFGDFAGERADVIILMQVTDDAVQMLSLPRDLKVEIPGHGTDKINAAYAYGGPDLLVETVTAATGIPVGHYMEVDFGGFAEIVDALGGIELDFPHPARDSKSGLDVGEAGLQEVDGATALAYARSRSYEELIDGEWQSTSGGDVARTGRQREVLMEIIDKASSPTGVLRSPLVLNEVTSNLTVDETVTPLLLARTGWGFRSAGATQALTLPVVGSTEGGIAYVVRAEPQATEVLEAFAAARPLPVEGG